MIDINRIKGLQTIETIMQILNIKKQTAFNLVSKLKKEGYLTASGKKRIYKISNKKIPKQNGMFGIINKYSKIKINPSFIHNVFGEYKIENALVDALMTKSFRIIFSSLYLFQKIKDWKLLYQLAKKNDIVEEIGILRDLIKNYLLLSHIPKRYEKLFLIKAKKLKYIVPDIKSSNFIELQKKYNVAIPFSIKEMEELK